MSLIASDQKFTGRAGDFFQQTVASTGTVEYWSAKDLPEGLGINNQSGVISGSPKSAGRFVATVTAEIRATQVAAGGMHSLALLRDGTVVSWGLDLNAFSASGRASEGVAKPSDLSGVVAIAAGENHALALKSDGTVVAWGSNIDGQCSVPSGLGNVVEIRAGTTHSLARKGDGTIVGWGKGLGTIPAPLDGYVAIGIRAGDGVSLALYERRQSNPLGVGRFVLSWGVDKKTERWLVVGGQFAVYEEIDRNPIRDVPRAVTLSETDVFDWMRRNDVLRVYDEGFRWKPFGVEQVGGWRYFTHGGIEVGAWDVGYSSAIAFGYKGLGGQAVTSGLFAWGNHGREGYVYREGRYFARRFDIDAEVTALQSLPEYYEVSYNLRSEQDSRGSYIVVERRRAIRLLAAGDGFFFALKGDGKMLAWGDNTYGQLNIPKSLNDTSLYRYNIPTLRVPYDPLIALSAGGGHCLALGGDGWVVAWGRNNFGQGSIPSAKIEFQIAGAIDISSTATGVAGVKVLLGEAPKMLFTCEFICAVNTQAIFSNPTLRAEVYVSATLEGALAIEGMGFEVSASGVASATGVLDLALVPVLSADLQGFSYVAASTDGTRVPVFVQDLYASSTLEGTMVMTLNLARN